MKLFLSYTFICFSICFSTKALAQLKLSASSGFFNQNLSWSLAGNYAGQNPNIYSELTWKKVNGAAFTANAEYKLHNKIFVSTSLRHGFILSGIITDADYNGDNRTNRSYFEQFNAGNSNLFNSDIAAGYVFLEESQFSIAVSLGYSYDHENLNIRPGKEDSSIITTGLNSSYAITISGPHITTHFIYNLTNRISIGLMVKLLLINYDAKANWNLATNFQHPVSFRQLATGYALKNELRMSYALNKKLKLFISVSNDHLKTNGGDDVLYKSSGDALISHFNGAKGNSFYALFGVTYQGF